MRQPYDMNNVPERRRVPRSLSVDGVLSGLSGSRPRGGSGDLSGAPDGSGGTSEPAPSRAVRAFRAVRGA
ncbi:hypothetical protein GCM10018952_20780 [Streptosporangium vulgare]